MERPKAILVCEPTFFQIREVRNPWMELQHNQVDSKLALSQWNHLIESFSSRMEVLRVPSIPGLEDQVFTANPCFFGVTLDGQKLAVPSRMRHAGRRPEVFYLLEIAKKLNYKILENNLPFEGHGDALWQPGHGVIWGGIGPRTGGEIYPVLSKIFSAETILLDLVDPRYYHLDTCLCLLDEGCALYYPKAFSLSGIKTIETKLLDPIAVTQEEAEGMACNAYGYGKIVWIPAKLPRIAQELRKRSFEVIEINVGEFHKSGGSIFCMKAEVF